MFVCFTSSLASKRSSSFEWLVPLFRAELTWAATSPPSRLNRLVCTALSMYAFWSSTLYLRYQHPPSYCLGQGPMSTCSHPASWTFPSLAPTSSRCLSFLSNASNVQITGNHQIINGDVSNVYGDAHSGEPFRAFLDSYLITQNTSRRLVVDAQSSF